MTAFVDPIVAPPRRIVTPEGVALELRIPDATERLAAFVIDAVFVLMGTILIAIITVMSMIATQGNGLILAFWIVVQFLFFNGYFIYFESRPRGATPGKRRVGMRVIDRRGGALRTDQIVARNIVRNFEFIFPVVVASTLAQHGVAEHAGQFYFCIAVALACAISPIFHRDHLRVGDWLAGTLVVAAPQARLLQDLGRARNPTATHAFTREQLSVYGVFELQVLEDLLRSGGNLTKETATTVAAKIRKKIRYSDSVDDPKLFLREFYAAQRAHLERELALGRRKESKSDVIAKS